VAQFRSAALLRGHAVRWFVPSDAGTRLVEPPALRPDHRKEADDGDRELIVLDKGRIGGGFAKSINALTSLEQKENILPCPSGNFAMSESTRLPDIDPYERACDQAIAMCDGDLRSTIKVLLMANEYLEAELRDLQAAASPARSAGPKSDAA
jgi:hypothetical protein